MPRRYLLMSLSLVTTGPGEDAVGIESFLQRLVRRSGTNVSMSPRLGLESEVVSDWLKLRGGLYYEPPRLQDAKGRVHGTAGLDFKLFRWNVFGRGPEDYLWKLGLSADAASRYFAWGFMSAVGIRATETHEALCVRSISSGLLFALLQAWTIRNSKKQ